MRHRAAAVVYGRVQVSLVHEWLTNVAGSEKVVASLRRAFPGSVVHTSMRFTDAFPGWDPVRTTFLQPFATGPDSHVRVLPLMPAAFRSLRVADADAVVTSFHTFALHARTPADATHVVYCHTPPRFLWSPEQLRGEQIRGRALMGTASRMLRTLDQRRARRPSQFVANSRAVAARIRQAYARDAEVVHPPVELDRFRAALGTTTGDYHLVAGRIVPYKRVDLAIEAFRLLGWPLVVAGSGRAVDALRAGAPPNVRFAGHVPDAELPGLLAGARALVFPGEEDFGITPVEAMAAGTPVVAFAAGGALETVVGERSGLFFDEATPAALATAVQRATKHEWDREDVSASVARFSEARFVDEMVDVVRAARG